MNEISYYDIHGQHTRHVEEAYSMIHEQPHYFRHYLKVTVTRWRLVFDGFVPKLRKVKQIK